MDFEETADGRVAEGFPPFPGKPRGWEASKPIEIDVKKLEIILKSVLKEFNLEFNSIKKIIKGEWRVLSTNKLGNHVATLVWTKYMLPVEKGDVEDLYEDMIKQNAQNSVFITTSHFTKEAQEFAEHLPITLLDGRTVGELIPSEKIFEVEKAFLTSTTDSEAVKYFRTRRKRKLFWLIGEEENIEYIDRRYIPFALYNVWRGIGTGEERSHKFFIDLTKGDMMRLEGRELVTEGILRRIMELPEESRGHLLDLISYGKLSLKNIDGKHLEILEKEGLVTIPREGTREKSFLDMIIDEISDTGGLIARNTANLANPKESKIEYEYIGHPAGVSTQGREKVHANVRIPKIDRPFDLEQFMNTSLLINEDFDPDEARYDVEVIRDVLERIYQNRVEFKGVIYMPYYLCKYKTAYRVRYLQHMSPSFNEQIIPKKTAEYGLYRFIDKHPVLPYTLLGAICFIMGLNEMEKTVHIFSSITLFIGVCAAVGVLLKAVFRTPRRVPRYGESLIKFGFPSIHSMLSAGSIGFIYFVNPLILIILIPMAFMYIYSRIAIGVHSMEDVMGGAVIGFIIGVLSGVYLYNGLYLPGPLEAFFTLLFFIMPFVMTYIDNTLH